MARTSKSRGATPFTMKSGNNPAFKMMGSSPVKQDYTWDSFKAPEPFAAPENKDGQITIDDSKAEKVKPQDIKIADTGKTGSTSSRPSGEKFVTSSPDTEPTAKAGKSSGMSDATKATILGEIGKIGDKMAAEAQAKAANRKSFGEMRSTFSKKK